MTLEELRKSAEFYARIDRLRYLAKAVFEFDQASGHLVTTYVIDRQLVGTKDDDELREECELVDGELIAAFPEIRTAETIYVNGIREEEGRATEVVAVLK